MPLSGHRTAHKRAKRLRKDVLLLLLRKAIPRAFKRL
jgi:hypothetical protein